MPSPAFETWPDPLKHVTTSQQHLWNTLVGLFEANRERYDQLLAAHDVLGPLKDAVAQARTDLDEQRILVKRYRKEHRTRTLPEAVAKALAQKQEAVTEARSTYKTSLEAQRHTLTRDASSLLSTLWSETTQAVKDAPLPWYNARLVGDSFRNAVERFLRGQGGPPRPRHHTTQAHVTYHFTGAPMSWEALCSGKTSMVQIAPVPDLVWDQTLPASARRAQARTTITLRITDTDALTFRATLMHRPPPGSLIKGVDLVGRETVRASCLGPSRWSWHVLLVTEVPPESIPVRDPEPRCALDVNWRILDDGSLRALTVYDTDQTYDVRFPASLVERWRYLSTLQTRIATLLEDTKQALVTLWETTPLPPDMQPPSNHWPLIRQQGLLRLLAAVEALPMVVPSREPTLALLRPWNRRSARLWREWRGGQGRLERAKAAWYAATAASLCRRYGTIAVESLDLKRLSRKDVEKPPRLAASQQYRQLLAPGALLLRLQHTAAREGVSIVKVNPAYTTRECLQCHARLSREENTGALYLTCPNGHIYDQDRSSAEMIYQRAFTPADDAPDTLEVTRA